MYIIFRDTFLISEPGNRKYTFVLCGVFVCCIARLNKSLIRESQMHLGWKNPLRSLSRIVNLTKITPACP